MEKLKLEVEVAKETYELAKGLEGVVAAVKKGLADGWQPGQDVPVMMLEALQALGPAVVGVEKVAVEASEPEAFADALYLGLKKIPFLFVKKAASEPVA